MIEIVRISPIAGVIGAIKVLHSPRLGVSVCDGQRIGGAARCKIRVAGKARTSACGIRALTDSGETNIRQGRDTGSIRTRAACIVPIEREANALPVHPIAARL